MSATLTVDQDNDSSDYGCSGKPGHSRCSRALTDDDFVYGGTTYDIQQLTWNSSSNRLELGLATGGLAVTGFKIQTDLSSLTLNVGGTTFAFNASTGTSNLVYWSHDPAKDWKDGQTISVSLTAPRPPSSKPAKPTRLKATAGDAQVELSWFDQRDSTIAKHQYRQKDGRADWGSWTDIPNSASGGTNATSYTVTGLNNGTAYQFRIRAVNALGHSEESDVAGPVTPVAVPPVITGRAITSDPGDDRTYHLGESIEITFTFSEAVFVAGGKPHVALRVAPGIR